MGNEREIKSGGERRGTGLSIKMGFYGDVVRKLLILFLWGFIDLQIQPRRAEKRRRGANSIFSHIEKKKEKKESIKFGYTNIYINFYCHSLSCSFFAPLLSPAFHLHVRAMLSFRFGRGINVRGGMI